MRIYEIVSCFLSFDFKKYLNTLMGSELLIGTIYDFTWQLLSPRLVLIVLFEDRAEYEESTSTSWCQMTKSLTGTVNFLSSTI